MKNYRNEKYPSSMGRATRYAEKQVTLLKLKGALSLGEIFSNRSYLKYIPKGAGLYVFIEKSRPVYVGISRLVRSRLRQHGWGKRHNEATLAYLIAEHELKHKVKRSKLRYEQVKKVQTRIRSWKVATLAIDENDPYILYFLEVYLAGLLKTKWNTFRTH